MHATVPCPVCRTTITFISQPLGLACPFCQVPIQFRDGKMPVGEKVRCGKCKGVFTAESPPSIRVFASTVRPCPFCHGRLAVRNDTKPGKNIRCPRCLNKFPHIPCEAHPLPVTTPPVEPEVLPALAAPVAPLSPPTEPPTATPVLAPVTPAPSHPPVAAPPPVVAPQPVRPAPSPLRKSGSGTVLVLGRKPGGSSRTQLAPQSFLDEQGTPPPLGPPATDDDVDFDFVPKSAQPTVFLPQAKKPAPPIERPASVAKKEPIPEPFAPSPRPTVSAETPIAVIPPQAKPATPPAKAKRPPAKKTAKPKPSPKEEPPEPEPPAAPKPAPRPSSVPARQSTPSPRPIAVVPPRPIPRPTKPVVSDQSEPWLTRRNLLIVGVVLLIGGGGTGLYFSGVFGRRVSPTTGVVLYKGKAVSGAMVVFHPESGDAKAVRSTGMVKEDGTFSLSTHAPDDGCPPGRYRVTVAPHDDYDPDRGGPPQKKPTKLVLPPKYADPKTSPLKAAIKRGVVNRVEFRLD